MPKYKFNIDNQDITDEKVNKHKDFKKLIANYNTATKPIYKTPLYKNKKIFLVLLLILLITYLIVEYVHPEKKSEQNKIEQNP